MSIKCGEYIIKLLASMLAWQYFFCFRSFVQERYFLAITSKSFSLYNIKQFPWWINHLTDSCKEDMHYRSRAWVRSADRSKQVQLSCSTWSWNNCNSACWWIIWVPLLASQSSCGRGHWGVAESAQTSLEIQKARSAQAKCLACRISRCLVWRD